MIGLKLGLGKDGKVTSTTPPVEESYILDGQSNQLLGGDGLPILDGDN